jgi:exosortase E/protease (VPEID-CTERM system)
MPDFLGLPARRPRAALLVPLRLRGLGLTFLLVLELLALSVRFDVRGALLPFAELDWLTRDTGALSLLLKMTMAGALAALAFGGGRCYLEATRGEAPREAAGVFWTCLGLHLVAVTGIWALSELWLGRTGVRPEPWVVPAWVLTCGCALASWAFATLPVETWVRLVRNAASSVRLGVVVGIAAVLLAQVSQWFWHPLGAGTTWAVHGLLQLYTRDLVYDPASRELGTRGFHVHIAPVCSGYEGIGLVWILLIAFLWLSRKELRFPRALLLVPLGTLLIWALNALRIAALIVIGDLGHPDLALGGFHSQAGWLAFNAVGLGLIAAAQNLAWLRRPVTAQPLASRGSNHALPYLLPLLVLVATTMVTGALSTEFDRLYPARIATVGLTLWLLRRDLPRLARPQVALPALIGVAVFAIWLALEPAAGGTRSPESLRRWLAGLPPPAAWSWLAARVVGSVVLVPVVEELAFRGYLTRRLIAADVDSVPPGRFTWFSFLASSLAFGVLHQRWLAGTLAGMLYALAYYRRGRVADAALAHALTNGLIAAYALATATWSLLL